MCASLLQAGAAFTSHLQNSSLYSVASLPPPPPPILGMLGVLEDTWACESVCIASDRHLFLYQFFGSLKFLSSSFLVFLKKYLSEFMLRVSPPLGKDDFVNRCLPCHSQTTGQWIGEDLECGDPFDLISFHVMLSCQVVHV